MGIKLRKGNAGRLALPAFTTPGLTNTRRSSLPPLADSPRRSACITHKLGETRDLGGVQKLPIIDCEASSLQTSPRSRTFINQICNPAVEEFDTFAEDDLAINVTEPGFEEAEGITQSESLGQNYSNERKQDMFFFDNEDFNQVAVVRNIDLCGCGRGPSTPKSHSFHVQTPTENVRKITQLSVATPQGPSFTMKGSQAKYQPRPVISQCMSSRSVSSFKSGSQTRILPRRPPASDNMVSMEERLAKSAKADAIRRSKSERRLSSAGKSKKSKRSKTAGNKPKKNVCLLTCIKPSNLEAEKAKFMKSNYTYNPQFKYEYHASPNVLTRYSKASTEYLPQALAIMKRVLERYGNYEKFEWATGGQLLTKTQLWITVKRYLEKEGFYGDVVVNISNDLIARAAMTVTGGRPTLSIRESAAKKLWVEGLLRHEIGTHHLRFHNNRQQIWHNAKVRRQMGLKPANPTEEGLASLHSVLTRKDPSLWRSAILYYTTHKASQMSFCDLFRDLGQFMDNPEVRWDYCLRCKRGQFDTSKPGCFSKDQVYLTGILELLKIRHSLDFHLLCGMGKVSHEDIEMLKPHYNQENTKIPGFMEDLIAYRACLDHIVEVNGLEDWLGEDKKVAGDSGT